MDEPHQCGRYGEHVDKSDFFCMYICVYTLYIHTVNAHCIYTVYTLCTYTSYDMVSKWMNLTSVSIQVFMEASMCMNLADV